MDGFIPLSFKFGRVEYCFFQQSQYFAGSCIAFDTLGEGVDEGEFDVFVNDNWGGAAGAFAFVFVSAPPDTPLVGFSGMSGFAAVVSPALAADNHSGKQLGLGFAQSPAVVVFGLNTVPHVRVDDHRMIIRHIVLRDFAFAFLGFLRQEFNGEGFWASASPLYFSLVSMDWIVEGAHFVFPFGVGMSSAVSSSAGRVGCDPALGMT